MRLKKPTNHSTSGIVLLSELPARCRDKRKSLEVLPQVEAATEAILNGDIASGFAFKLELTPEEIERMRLAAPGRILAGLLRDVIAESGAKSKAGKPLKVVGYKSEADKVVVYVCEDEGGSAKRPGPRVNTSLRQGPQRRSGKLNSRR